MLMNVGVRRKKAFENPSTASFLDFAIIQAFEPGPLTVTSSW